jgi:ubiquinone/menaquinone biosynthesis C-methylase UbiE
VGHLVNRTEKRAFMRSIAALPQTATVFEAACGTGRMTELLLDFGHETLATDVSSPMLQRAVEALGGRNGLQGFALCDASRLPIRSNAYDAYVAFRILSHLPRAVRAALLAEAARIARVTVILSVQSPWSAHFIYRYIFRPLVPRDPPFAISVKKLTREAKEAGLAVVSVNHAIPFLAETYVVTLQKNLRPGPGAS